MDAPKITPTNPFRARQTTVAPNEPTGPNEANVTYEAKATLITNAQEKMSSMTDADDDDREENIDDLIEELAFLDGGHPTHTNRKSIESAKTCNPNPGFDTDITTGLSSEEATIRRKKYGPNQLKEAKENLYLKFLSFFVGPVQFVMEVSI
jgi:H+-transporting ATPase